MFLKKFSKKFALNAGQAMAEYALILVIVAILFGVTLAATGPAIGNVFSNAVYNLIGGRPEEIDRLNDPGDGRGRSSAFWATVEWLVDNPPEERASGLNTPLPPPPTATEGPTPTPSPITPSPLPSNTPTVPPTATPRDRQHIAPWLDKINDPDWWRVDSSVWVGSDQWIGDYYANNSLSGTPTVKLSHQQLGLTPAQYSNIDFMWPSGTGPIESGFVYNDFSVSWTRQLYNDSPNPLLIRFTVSTGGGQSGARLWLYERDGGMKPVDGCSSVAMSDGRNSNNDDVYADGQSPSGSPTDCLVVNAWRDNEETFTVTRTLQPGTFYMVQMDYYKRNGAGSVSLGVEGTTGKNLNDATVPAGGVPQCAWFRPNTTRANSPSFIWEEARVGEFPQNQICYLELRGWVHVSQLSNPKLIFWDVWDLGSANTDVWLEVGQYNADPAARTWQQVPLNRGGTTNYAWTRNIIDLSPYVSGEDIALRFAMRDAGGSTNRRWYVDDIEIRDFNTKTFGICTGTRLSDCANVGYFNMENPTQLNGNAAQGIDPLFITTGRWTLTSNNAKDVLAWDSGPAISNFEGSRRVHSLELNGLVDVTGSLADFEGDDGAPVLSFEQAYVIEPGTRLEVQWTRDVADAVPDNWTTLATIVDNPTGSGTTLRQDNMTQGTMLLNNIPSAGSSPFRLRWVMSVHQNATQSGSWNIDNIVIHRFDAPRFSDYPFLDTAQDDMSNWLAEGTWGQTNSSNYTPNLFAGSGLSFTDSPLGNYAPRANASLILRHPLDLNFDTPENLAPADTSNVQSGPATNPVLSFWHWRNIDSQHEIRVEWSNDRGLSWKSIWNAWPAQFNSSIFSGTAGQNQQGWEYVEVDLSDIQANIATNGASATDDDIIIRFRLDARANSATRDGLYLDDIRIENRTETSHKLWDPLVNHPTYGSGHGRTYTDDFDSGDYRERWLVGGDWTDIENEQHSGLIAMHESPQDSGGNDQNTRDNTYHILELRDVIDLRAVTGSNNPALYFWTRFRTGRDTDNIKIEIATENTGYTPTGGDGIRDTNDYERRRGWNDWATATWARGPDSRVQTWQRAAVDLTSFAGQRIKIRFAFNGLDGDHRDGWYIDDLRLEHRNTQPFPLSPFTDNARSTDNWIMEGSWGLAPDQWRGAGGGPADLGTNFWNGVYYDCEVYRGSACSSLSHYNNILYTNYSTGTERTAGPEDLTEAALEIDHEFGSTGKPSGAGNNDTWLDYYAARWTRNITISNPATVTFITASDDGIRMRYQNLASPTAWNNWNIVENWSTHGRWVDVRAIDFVPGNYKLTLEWFEASGGAVIVVSAGVNSFSFADSPKAGNGPSFPVVNSTPYGDSSMMLRRPISLAGTNLPIVEYFNRRRLGSGSTAMFEVSTNGGFTWTTSNLSSSTNGFSCPGGTSCGPTYSGNYWPSDPTDWQRRMHNLSAYKPNLIYVRWRLTTGSDVEDGFYVTDIAIFP